MTQQQKAQPREKLSLAPLTFNEALDDILRVKPMPKAANKKQAKSKKLKLKQD